MSVFFEKNINPTTKLGIWLIEEDEAFFREKVPLHRHVTHPHKRLQHLAGRFLLKYLFPDFPSHLVQIADTRKPYLPDEEYHFSISHCGDFAAAIVSKNYRVGIDIEIPDEKAKRIRQKFISKAEMEVLNPIHLEEYTQIWSAKETVFKWYSKGEVDFRQHIQLREIVDNCCFRGFFTKNEYDLDIFIKQFSKLCLSYVFTPENQM